MSNDTGQIQWGTGADSSVGEQFRTDFTTRKL